MKTLISIVLSLFAISLFAQKGGGKINQGGGQGTVTNIALTVPSGLVVSGSPITNAGTFAVTNNMSSGVVKSNGVGSSLATSLVNILSETTGTLSVARGGTGLTALGSANQLIRVNSGGTALEYFTPTSSYLPLAGGTMTGNILFSADNTLDLGASGATRPRTGYFGTSVLAPLFNASTGFQIAGAATSGNYLRGNGTNFVSSAIQAGDIPDLGATYWKIGGQAVGSTQALGTTGANGINFITNNTNRLRFDSGGRMFSGTLTDVILTTSDSARIHGGNLTILGDDASNTFLNALGFVGVVQGNGSYTTGGNSLISCGMTASYVSLGNSSFTSGNLATFTATDSTLIGTGTHRWVLNETTDVANLYTNSSLAIGVNASQEVGIGTTPSSGIKLLVNGTTRTNGKILSYGVGDSPGSSASNIQWANSTGPHTFDAVLQNDASLDFVSNTGATTLEMKDSNVNLGASTGTITNNAPMVIVNLTATAASALTPAAGMFIYVTDTNGTFTSIGFWGYENGAWVKL